MEKEEKTCGKCKHFRRHYVRRESDWYMPLRVGHCVTPYCRDKKEDTKACWRYVEKEETT